MVLLKLTLNISQMQGYKVNQVNKFQVCQAYLPKRREGGLVKLRVYKVRRVYKVYKDCVVVQSAVKFIPIFPR